ncbi:S15A3 protein, partial [Rhinopomastus cyanomelas]|nr:S15A3 protein [Rhinopomastus cyanomelas]
GEQTPLLVGTPRQGYGAAWVTLLVVEALEKGGFLGIAASLVPVLSSGSLAWGGTQVSCAHLILVGASHLLAPIGGWVADVYLGHRGTVLLSLSLYLLATGLMPTMATLDGRLSLCGEMPAATITQNCSGCQGKPPEIYCGATIYTGLFLLALSVGSIRANLVAFGGDQVKDQHGVTTRRFFNWFYWSSNVGAIFSLLVVALVQQQISVLASSFIPVACVVLALLIFLLATPTLVTKPPRGSQVSTIIKLTLQSCGCTRERSLQLDPEDLLPSSRAQPGAPSLKEDLENFQGLSRILPVMLAFIPHWMVFFQMQSAYHLQGLQLHSPGVFQHGQDHTSALQTYTLPSVWHLLATTMPVVALVPLKDLIVDPFLARRRLVPSALQQVALGMFFSLMSLLAAGVLEWQRLQDQTVPEANGEGPHPAAPLPIWWQLPQYLLMGISQLLANISALEFTFAEAPDAMKGATMGVFFFFVCGVGWFLGWGLLTLCSLPTYGGLRCPQGYGDLQHEDMRVTSSCCRLDSYFPLLGGIQSAASVLFAWVSRSYRGSPAAP